MEVFKMARNYSEEEKQKLLDKYKVSGKSKSKQSLTKKCTKLQHLIKKFRLLLLEILI